MPRKSKGSEPDQVMPAGNGHFVRVRPPPSDAGGGGQTAVAIDGQALSVPAARSMLIAKIRGWHRERCFAMEQRKRIDLALGAYLRTQLGWRRDLPEADRKKITETADELMAEKLLDARFTNIIAASAVSRAPWEAIEKDAKANLERLAIQLPIWKSFGEAIRGFGLVSLAVIVGEAGDLSLYSDHSKLWKRMGLAVFNGARQGNPGKNASKEEWIAHGYSPARRSRVWNIGDSLIKSNQDGHYRTVYLARKAHELKRNPEMTKMHAHRRAQRYMEKRLLRNLWRAWRDQEKAKRSLPIKASGALLTPEQKAA